MQAQIILTPTESKKLIAQATLNLPVVQNALEKGNVVIHPSSTTIFIYEEILGRMPLPGELWVCGVIVPKGLCGSHEAVEMIEARGSGIHDPRKVSSQAWFFKKGVLQKPAPLGEILDQMTENDVYIKGCNALDPQGKVGVLFGNAAGGGGTIGKVILAQREKHFHMLLPVGIEKLIPVSISEASHKAGFKSVDKAMGVRCGLIPVPGQKIDEVDALFMVSGIKATPIAAGGLGGAEGAVVLALDGDNEQLEKALEVAKTVKGAQLPVLHLKDCSTCPAKCNF